jgi:hypothetical protein
LTTLGGSAAALLGALYALGAAVEWKRLTHAGVRVVDALPLVPLPHVLTAGISVLLSMAIAFIGVTGFLLLLRGLDQLVESRRIHRHLARYKRAMKTSTVIFRARVARATQESDRLADIRVRLAEFAEKQIEIPTPKTEEERAKLSAYSEDIKRLLEEAKLHNADRDALIASLPKLRRDAYWLVTRTRIQMTLYKQIVPTIRYGPLAFGSVVGVLFVPYPIGASLIVVGLLWALGTKINVPAQLLRATLYVVVGLGVITNGIGGAPSLPDAQLVTGAGSVHGPLIASTDTTWYITVGRGTIQPIEIDRVLSGVTVLGRVRHLQTLGRVIEDAL